MRVMLLLAALAAFAACRTHDRVIPPAPVGAPTGIGSVTPASANAPDLVQVPPGVVGDIELREIAHGLERPVLLTHAPVSPANAGRAAAPRAVRSTTDRRLFVVLQRGKIVILGRAGPPFFTIGGLSDGNEQGLLGLAFHPDFAKNGRLYVDYTTRDKATHVVEYKVSASDPDRVDPTTARELIRIEHPFSNHNGGNLAFGPDGKLYLGMGDGGSANDPFGNGQNPTSLLGKLMRFDVDAPKPAPEIVDIGLRNPWRYWFDAKTHDLYIGNVGQNLWESVYVVPSDGKRRNFGWNVVEGSHCFDAKSGTTPPDLHCDRSGFTLPVAEYGHDEGCSVTGGVTYRGRALPVLDGRYFYADYCTGLLRSFRWTGTGIADHWDWKPALDRAHVLQQISSFGTDSDGEVYIVELTGSIYELVPRDSAINDGNRCVENPLAPGCS